MTVHVWQEVLLLIGLTTEGVGIAVAIHGLRATWRDYSDEDMFPRWRGFTGRLADVRWWLHSRLAFVFGPPVREIRVSDSGHVTDSVTGLSQALTDWGNLLDDPGEATHQLDRRLRELLGLLARQNSEWRAAMNDLRDSAGLELARESITRRDETRRAAIGGAKTAMAGLAMVIAGIALQGAAVLWALLVPSA